jgi:hypothetical protein
MTDDSSDTLRLRLTAALADARVAAEDAGTAVTAPEVEGKMCVSVDTEALAAADPTTATVCDKALVWSDGRGHAVAGTVAADKRAPVVQFEARTETYARLSGTWQRHMND